MSAEQLITKHLDIWTSAHKIRSSAGRGSSNKLDLYGIKKLRELILELAVRGKLVPQDPNDEPASELLKKITAFKQRQIKEKKIKKTKMIEDVESGSDLFELPSSWGWAHLNDLGDWGAGATPSRANSAYYGGNIPWFKSGELNEDFISHSEESVTELALKDCSLRQNQIGDVLIAMYGATIGKSSILSIAATTNQAVCACTPFEGIFNRFLLLLLRSFKSRFIGMGAGGAQPNISKEKIVATAVPVPPLVEQHRIVAKVDELMDFCDELEQAQTDNIAAHAQLVEALLTTLTNSKDHQELQANWQRIAEHFDTLFTTEDSIDQLKQTILQLAVMGKLVPQDSNDEPASELLKKIAAEKAQLIKEGKIKKEKPLPAITDEEKPSELPNGWEWVRFRDVANSRLGKMLDKAKNAGEIKPYLRNTNVQWGVIDLSDIKTMKLQESELSEFKLHFGDLLICEGGYPGRCAIWKHANIEMYFQKALHRARSYRGVYPEYLQFCLFNDLNTGGLDKYISGATIQHFTGDKLDKYVIPLAPSNTQYRVINKVNELMTLCDSLKAEIQSVQNTELRFADALVEQAVS